MANPWPAANSEAPGPCRQTQSERWSLPIAQKILPRNDKQRSKKVIPDKCASAQSAFEKKRIIIKPLMAPVRDLLQLIEFTTQGRLQRQGCSDFTIVACAQAI